MDSHLISVCNNKALYSLPMNSHSCLKIRLCNGRDFIKLTIWTASSSTFFSEGGIFFVTKAYLWMMQRIRCSFLKHFYSSYSTIQLCCHCFCSITAYWGGFSQSISCAFRKSSMALNIPFPATLKYCKATNHHQFLYQRNTARILVKSQVQTSVDSSDCNAYASQIRNEETSCVSILLAISSICLEMVLLDKETDFILRTDSSPRTHDTTSVITGVIQQWCASQQ